MSLRTLRAEIDALARKIEENEREMEIVEDQSKPYMLGSRSCTLPKVCPGRHHAAEHHGRRPEVAHIATTFEDDLKAAGLNFDAQFKAHERAFDDVSKLVRMHCDEQGRLLERLHGFFASHVRAFVRITRKRQQDVGVADLDESLSALAQHQHQCSRKARALKIRIRRLEEHLNRATLTEAERHVLMSSEEMLELGSPLRSLMDRLQSSPTSMRVELISTLLQDLDDESKVDTMAAVAGAFSSDLSGSVLQKLLQRAAPGNGADGVLAQMRILHRNEAMKAMHAMVSELSQEDIARFCSHALGRLSKERTMAVVEIIMQSSTSLHGSMMRLFQWMASHQRHRLVQDICRALTPNEAENVRRIIGVGEAARAVARGHDAPS